MLSKLFSVSFNNTRFDVSTAFRDAGKDLIVFLHGLGCSSETFRGVWQRPEFNNYSILCLNQPGFGDSEAPEGFLYSMEEHAQVCTDVLSACAFENLHIVGHSMGGAIGLLLPREILDSVCSFANVEGNLNPEDCVFGSRDACSVPYDIFVNDTLPQFRQASENWNKNGLNVASPLAFYESAKSLVAWSDSGKLLQAFHGLSCHKTYIYGEKNAAHPTVNTVDGIPKIEIESAGHFVMNDNPEGFYSALLDFIRSWNR